VRFANADGTACQLSALSRVRTLCEHCSCCKPQVPSRASQQQQKASKNSDRGLLSSSGVELGPIGLTVGSENGVRHAEHGDESQGDGTPIPSIATMTTAEWRARYEKDGTVDLWVEEEFNAGSRLVVSSSTLSECLIICVSQQGGFVKQGKEGGHARKGAQLVVLRCLDELSFAAGRAMHHVHHPCPCRAGEMCIWVVCTASVRVRAPARVTWQYTMSRSTTTMTTQRWRCKCPKTGKAQRTCAMVHCFDPQPGMAQHTKVLHELEANDGVG
jgi:hypothetical protein